MQIEHIRAQDAKAKSEFYAGLRDIHPHGRSGLGWITAPEEDRRCLDGGEYQHLSGS